MKDYQVQKGTTPLQPENLTVVYHCCCAWDFAPLVCEQLRQLAAVGLTHVLCTHVGEGREWLQGEAVKAGVNLLILRSDSNIAHYETFAMLLIEQLAKVNEGAVLYLHTKGVSEPASELHRRWRALMQREVVDDWRVNLASLATHDVCGVGWGYNFSRPHFPGNFWMARWDWIRRLPDFVAYHHAWRLERFSCEAWIGAAPNPRVNSRLCINTQWHEIVARFMQ
jgi:hypothetical protein